MAALLSAQVSPTRRVLGRLPDERLGWLVARGSHDAFGAIHERYAEALYRYGLAIVGDPNDARDVLQAAMLGAYRGLGERSKRIALRPWLYRIVHNEAISLIRRRREHDELTDEHAPVTVTLEAEVADRQRIAELWDDLLDLPPRQREALVLHGVHGLRYREMAAVLDISPQAAKQAALEARRALVEIGAGREQDCADVVAAIHEGTRHVLRRRMVRAHLRHCTACRERAALARRRQRDLGALWAALPGAGGGAGLSLAGAGTSSGLAVGSVMAGGLGSRSP